MIPLISLFIFFQDQNTFSIFYGQDFRRDSPYGASPELRYGDPVIVKKLEDVKKIPTRFDFQSLIESHRDAFDRSNVRVAYFINVVYIVYKFIDPSFQLDQRRRKKTAGK